MSDFKVSALFETNAPQVQRDVNQVADSLDRVGTSAASASRGTDQLATASGRLAKARADAALADERVAKMQDRTDASRPRVLANMNEYKRALDQQATARVRLAKAIEAGQAAQAKADAQSPRSGAPGRTIGAGGIAAGVGIGVAGEKAAEILASKARDFVTGSIEQASKLSDTITSNGQVFGTYAQQVDQFGKSAASSLGLSRQAAVETADAFGTLFHGVGVDGSQAAGLSTNLTKLGVDLAAFKQEADPGQAFNALEQALSGQYDALHRYGIVLTGATVRDEAFRLGLIRTRTEALTPQATAIAAATLAGEKADAQTGAFARSTDDLAGKQKILSANIQNAQADLGKGLLPAMSGAAEVAEGTLIPALSAVGKAIGFIGEHDATRNLAELAVLMYGLSKAVDVAGAAYARLAGTAAAAAGAETAAAGAGAAGAGAAAGGGGLLSRLFGSGGAVAGTAAGGGGIATGIGALRGFPIIGAGGLLPKVGDIEKGADGLWHTKDGRTFRKSGDQLVEVKAPPTPTAPAVDLRPSPLARARTASAAADFNVRDARAYLDSRSYVKDAGSIPLGGLFDALPEKPDQSVVQNARDEQKAASAALAIAHARVAKARRGSGGASAGQLASAQASVLTAQDAVRKRGGDTAAEQLRLQAAEAHLAQLRHGGKTDTVALMTAENNLETARTRQRKAAEALHKAEKEASGEKSLTLQEVLARAAHTAGTATAEVGNVRKLVKAGVSAPVIAELEQLEQSAPGTMAKVAKGITPAFVKQINADHAARDKAAEDLAKLGGEAKLADLERTARAAGARLAAAFNDGYQHGFPKSGPAPTPGVAAGITVPPQVIAGPTSTPAPVVVSPRTTHHHNTFPNVKTTAQQRAELDKLERLDAMR